MAKVTIDYEADDMAKAYGEFDCFMMVARRKGCRGYAVFSSIPGDELTEAMAVFNYQVLKEIESRGMIQDAIPSIGEGGEQPCANTATTSCMEERSYAPAQMPISAPSAGAI